MANFGNDYLEGGHPKIIEALVQTNMEQTVGYGLDPHSERARNYIQEAIGMPGAAVHFLVGGTQTNSVVIRSVLKPHEGVIAATTGHISEHETGAIESGGHKVLTIPSRDGKLSLEDLEDLYHELHESSVFEHIVQPGMVYISHPTEMGTVYQKEELRAISNFCRQVGLTLFVDGARLAYALDESVSDISLEDLAELSDIFYIGGTKCGALFGEAVVITNDHLKPFFRNIMKQQGALLAKGRLLGLQFETLFRDGLYQSLGKKALKQVLTIRQAFEAKGFQFYGSSTTNQQFVLVNEEQRAFFVKQFGFQDWCILPDGQTVVRYCTSWATQPEAVLELVEAIQELA